MDSELLATCNALGYLEEDEYFKEPDCLDNVKCLIKYLHNEDSTRDVRTQLGSIHVVQNDLIPILSQFPKDSDLFHAVLRLLINLTQPALLCFGGRVPKDSTMNHHFLEVVKHNQAYKEAFGNHEKIWDTFTQKIYDILETDWEDRSPEEGLVVERFLILLRNLLHVPPTTGDKRKIEEDVSSHDKLLWQMHRAGVDSLLLYMSGSNTEQELCLHLLEIICLFLKEQDAEKLAKAGQVPSRAERQREGDELLEMRKAEEAKRRQQRAKMTPWHSRFGGSYVKVGTKALADGKDLIVHKSVQHCEHISFDDGKSKLRKAKNRRALVEGNSSRRSSVNIGVMLKNFCVGFLENGYNTLMRSVRDRMVREKAQDHDESYYFWSMNFFMEFNRFFKFRIELVSETMQLSILHFLDVKMMEHFELMATDKQDAATWGKRMHLALRCYHQFLKTVYTMEASNDPALKESAKVLMNNLFYMVEYREVFLTLLRKFDERNQTRGFLKDLVLATHLFLKMFEGFCRGNKLVVEKRVRSHSKRKAKPSSSSAPPPEQARSFTEEEKASKWSEVQTLLTAVLEEPTGESDLAPPNVFDPVSDAGEATQQQQALLEVQQLLLSGELKRAVLTLRTARSVWPERNLFGDPDASTDQESRTLHEICLADLSNVQPKDPPTNEQDQDEEAEIEEEEEVQSAPQRRKEIEFNLDEFIKKFADSRVVQPYAKLLQEFESNDDSTNHCLVKMLHRIGFDLKMYGLLFQASLFRIFQKAFVSTSKQHKEIATLGRWLIGKFYEVWRRNDCIFAEMLFWKSSVSDVYELTEGYGTYRDPRKPSKVTWTEEENDELLELFVKYKGQDTDLVDGILSSITDQSRTRRQICNQLVKRGLVDSVVELKRPKGAKSTVWREEEVDELRRLHEEFAKSSDPLGSIMQMLSSRKSKAKVIEKLMSLGLVTDRKELYKKRAGKSKSGRPPPEIMHIGADDSDVEPSERDETDDDDLSDVEIDASRIQRLTQECSSSQLNVGVSWLKENLQTTLEDRETTRGDLEPVPLVPLTEEHEDAMADKSFKRLLKSVGILPPSSGQETFWRIPATLSSENLRAAVASLSLPVKKRKRLTESFDSDDDVSNDEGPSEKRPKNSDEVQPAVPSGLSLQGIDSDEEISPKKARPLAALESDDESDDDQATQSRTEDKIQGSSDDDDENSHGDKRKKRKRVLSDDDESD